jgi:acetyltransferase-like isoleucine patch superfamily enzyme
MQIKKHNYNQSLPENKYNPLSWIQPEAKIGDNCWIGAFCYIAHNVEIGDNVSLANGVQIFDHDTSWYRATRGQVQPTYYKVTIEDDIEIGANAVIIPNGHDITIGHNTIVGALSFVRDDIPPYSVAVGIPAKVVKRMIL